MCYLFIGVEKRTKFEWNTECNDTFESQEKILDTPPILTRPSLREILYLYLAVVKEVVCVVIIRETYTDKTRYTSYQRL